MKDSLEVQANEAGWTRYKRQKQKQLTCKLEWNIDMYSDTASGRGLGPCLVNSLTRASYKSRLQRDIDAMACRLRNSAAQYLHQELPELWR